VTQVVRPYRGVSADDRRSERRRRLVAAGLEVVGRDGVHGTTIEAVCREAQLTKRYFYENFADRDELLVAALDELFTSLRQRMRAVLVDGGSPDRRARAVVDILVSTLTDDARLARLYVECPGHHVLRARRDEAITTFTQLVANEVLDFGKSGRWAKDRELATRIIVAGTTDLITSWLSGAISTDRETLTAAIVAVGIATASATFTVSHPDPAGSSDADRLRAE
jgi:AcrR family transcriptional regulator